MTLAELHKQVAGDDQNDLPAFMAGAAAVLYLAGAAPGPFARDDLLAGLEREVRSYAAKAGAPTPTEFPAVL